MQTSFDSTHYFDLERATQQRNTDGNMRTYRNEMPKSIFIVLTIDKLNTRLHQLSGTLVSGELNVGDEIRVTTSGQIGKVTNILISEKNVSTAQAGDSLTLVLNRDIGATGEDIISLVDQPLETSDQFEVALLWKNDNHGLTGRTYEFKIANQFTVASITTIKYRINIETHVHEPCKKLSLGDIAIANLALSKPIVFEPNTASNLLDRFTLIDSFTKNTVAIGVIRHNLRRSQNVHRQALTINREDRECLNGHQTKVIWFTGLSGSGKSTIANELEKILHAQGKSTYTLDGDNVRQGLNKDLGFTDADRVENIRRVAEVARLMRDAGLIVMTSFISPFRAERQMARELIGRENFVEVFVDTPLEICEQRDPKGLYKKARNGQIPNMTGINSPYERPDSPDYVIQYGITDLQTMVSSLRDFLNL